jgi:hypothetical protein
VSRALGCLRHWRVLLSACLLCLGATGCATGGGDVAMVATISGGQKIRVPLTRNGAELTAEGGVQINAAGFTLNPDKKIVFVFECTDSRKRALQNVRVEDVSGDKPDILVEHTQPKLSDAGEWRGESQPLEWNNSRLAWLATLSNSLRVFRFTLTFTNGQALVIHQGTLFPAVMKSAVRQTVGQNY